MNDDLELVRGSGNVFRDFGSPNADLEQARAILAAKIIHVLDERKLSVRAAAGGEAVLGGGGGRGALRDGAGVRRQWFMAS